ncbi:MAG: TonB-dependent receptor, partial [Terriglobales bacterium]
TVRQVPLHIDMNLVLAAVASEVTVSAEAGQIIDVDRSAQRVNTIPVEELQLRAMTVMSQIAKEEIGLWQQRTSPTIGAVLVRGLNDVGVYVDGVRWTQSTQRGGINTFFNLNEPTAAETIEVLRGPSGAQYGSDSLAGTVSLTSRPPLLGATSFRTSGQLATQYATEDHSFGSNLLLNAGSPRFGVTLDLAGRRVNRLRPGGGKDTHAAVTRFLGLPSTIFGERLSDTGFTQYGGLLSLTATPTPDQQISFRYQRGQQDGGERYDQLLGGDGNLIADLRNLMMDFGYLRYQKERLPWFDHGSFTGSYNSQREERVNQGGQGNPNAVITRDRERTTTWGFNFNLDKQLRSHSILVGADIYRDKVNAPSFGFDPVSGIDSPTRPRVPHGAEFLLYGFFAQDSWEVVTQRLRVIGALRYNVASYRASATDAPVVSGTPLFPDDSLRVADWSGRAGAVFTLVDGANFSFNYSRGFRAPNITALGSVGLVGVGFQVSASALRGRNAFIGTTADATAVSSNVPVTPLISEYTNGYDAAFNFRRGRWQGSFGGFLMDYRNSIVRQTLILPPGAVGSSLGSDTIIQQDPSGAVYVTASTSPVLAQVNFGESQVRGLETELKFAFNATWSAEANYTYVYVADQNGLPPNTEGGTLPPQTMNLKIRFAPTPRYWIEAYSTLAGRQDRLSSLGLSDRRTGAARTRGQIQNFFRRGATVRGLVGAGVDGTFGNADDILLSTGETLAQVQSRVLGLATSAPLYTYLPGYGLFGVRGGMHLGEHHSVIADFENIADKNYRNASWGVPGPGRSLALKYSISF